MGTKVSVILPVYNVSDYLAPVHGQHSGSDT